MWKKLSSKTPCVIIECGVGMHVPDDWQILHFDRPKVVEGIVKGICLSFKVPYLLPIPEPAPIPEPEPEPEPPPEPVPPTPPETPPDAPGELSCCKKIKEIEEILHGRGWFWTKYRKIKQLLPKE